jgi:hypothetical protein
MELAYRVESKRQFVTDQHQHRRQTRTQQLIGDAPGEVAAQVNPRQRTDQQVTQHVPIHVTHARMAQTGNQRQRHGVRDFRTYQAAGRQPRIKNKQRHRTQRARAEGGQCLRSGH